MDPLATSNVIDMTPDNFQQLMVETSKEKLVLVDFWAQWCESCKALAPVMDKLAAEFSEHLILAKVDCDAQQQIAMQFGVRSLPTVVFVKDGQPIDAFQGAVPESEIRELLAKHLPQPEDELFAQGSELLAAGQAEDAFPLLKQALELASDRTDIKFATIECFIQMGRISQAKELIETVLLADQDNTYQALLGKIELAEKAAETPEILALQKAAQENPDDLQVKVDLAIQYQQTGKSEEALELLFQVVKKEMAFGDAKKVFLDSINALPEGDPLASKYRRKLYSLLY